MEMMGVRVAFLNFGTPLKMAILNSSILNSTDDFTGDISYHFTTISFLTLQLSYKLQNAQ
jgi:hypothetical protein